MLFLEEHARWLLVVHLFLAGALVAVSTHLVVWLRHWRRGKFTRRRGVLILSTTASALFVTTFVVGNLIYPVYKVRVRTEYLEQSSAVARDVENRAIARARAERSWQEYVALGRGDVLPERTEPQVPRVPPRVMRTTAKVALWFDVKEHWVALGLFLSIALTILLWTWKPQRDGPEIARIVFLMALGTAATTWTGAIIGAVVASYRSVGGL